MYHQNKKKANAALLKFYEESFLSTQINDRKIVTAVLKKIRPKSRYGKGKRLDLQLSSIEHENNADSEKTKIAKHI